MNWKSRVAASAAVAVTAVLIVGGLATAPALAATTAPTVSGGGLKPLAVAFSKTGSSAYVFEMQGFINVDSTTTKKVTHQIFNEGIPAIQGYNAGGALSADGKSIFMSIWDSISGSQLLQYSTSTRKLLHAYSLNVGNGAAQEMGAVAVSADGDYVYVWGVLGNDQTDAALFQVKLSDGSVIAVPSGIQYSQSGQTPSAVAVSPDGGEAWITTGSADIVEINTGSGAITRTVDTDSTVQGLALSPDGDTLYTAETGEYIEAITTATGVATTFANVTGEQFNAAAVTPNGNDLVVTGYPSGDITQGKTFVFATADGSLVSQVKVGSWPWAVAVSPTGTKAYVANSDSGTTSIVTLKNAAPAISSHAAPTTGTVGTLYDTTFSATGYPSPSYSFTGTLPTGVTLDATSGELKGNPSADGVFKFKIVAANTSGHASTSKTQTVTIKKALTAGDVTIDGTYAAGQTLTANPGDWGPGTVKLTFKWQRFSGSAWKTISGATKTTYKMTSSDATHVIRVTVTGSESGYTTLPAFGYLGV